MSSPTSRRVLVTGSRGFIGKNLTVRLREVPGTEVLTYDRDGTLGELQRLVGQADAIVHLAGENRPRDETGFKTGNADLTCALCEAINQAGQRTPVAFSSSIQATLDNPYGRSKRAAEQAIERLASEPGQSAAIYRLPNVFGKWCRPNYNSVVATFCHNIAHGLAIRIDDPAKQLRLVYVDDVVDAMLCCLEANEAGLHWREVTPEYVVTVGALAEQIEAFRLGRTTLAAGRVGVGLTRALYATYVSHLPVHSFAYDVPMHADARGVFVEMLKTPDSGQFSFFTARPGVTRGGHYHHTKTEKFLVVKGRARFAFRHLVTGERYELETTDDRARIVESIPGWSHDVTNVGEGDLIVMLWANEVFDRGRPDTVASKV